MPKKRNESALVTAVLKYMQCLENSKRIAWVDRLNSGTIKFNGRLFRGCRAGTPDIYAIMNFGNMIWIECKSEKGKWYKSQKDFCNMCWQFDSHIYLVVNSVDSLIEMISFIGVNCNDN